MRIKSDRHVRLFLGRGCNLLVVAGVAIVLLSGSMVAIAPQLRAQSQTPPQAPAEADPYTTWTVTIVLPPRLMAGHPATLAVLGVDGKLAAGVTVTVGDDQTVTTDRTGRALFSVPASGEYLVAKGSGASVAALIDPAEAASEPKETTLPEFVSVRDRFWICGPGLRGDADANAVRINDEPALVLAASPECLVALPGTKATPGPGAISVAGPGTRATAKTTLVALGFDAPEPGLLPERKSRLNVRVSGSDQKLRIVVENKTPGVLRFVHGETQELLTRGGPQNAATLDVLAIRTGDFSFRARLLPAPDMAVAQRYLQAAAAAAPKEIQSDIRNASRRLKRHPRDLQVVRAELGQILTQTISGDFRTLLSSAWEAL
jgi:hypothetical protein